MQLAQVCALTELGQGIVEAPSVAIPFISSTAKAILTTHSIIAGRLLKPFVLCDHPPVIRSWTSVSRCLKLKPLASGNHAGRSVDNVHGHDAYAAAKWYETLA